ncbi:MAG: CDP-diacylglycerol--serine O-phosphatidyltransferase [Chitinophagaceae bacterium]|nr:CDP-diacylglycerol--serine O-phosphatidyltransferase [Chitinophagaceae bacterium]
MKQIPNLFTLLNLFLGCLAIIAVLQNGIVIASTNEGEQLLSMPEEIYMASLFIGLAAVVDFFDGFIARLFNASSEMGKQLDSLADVVSFGVAPGIIIYQFLRLSLAKEENGLDASVIWLLPALVVPCAAAYRLAKFNVDESQTYSFRGVPTPAVGLLVASFPLVFWNNSGGWLLDLLLNKWFWYAVIAALSYLMVSNIPIMSLKFKDYTLKNNSLKLILAVIAVAAAFALHWLAVPVVFVAYILLSLLFKKQIA